VQIYCYLPWLARRSVSAPAASNTALRPRRTEARRRSEAPGGARTRTRDSGLSSEVFMPLWALVPFAGNSIMTRELIRFSADIQMVYSPYNLQWP
jgi:hypothetical protein